MLILGSSHGREAPKALFGLSESSFEVNKAPVMSSTTPLLFMALKKETAKEISTSDSG